MTSRGKQLRNAGSVEASFGQTEGGSQAGTASTDDNSIIFVVLQNGAKLVGHVLYRSKNRIRRTMTGYCVLTKGDASLARRGRFAKILAASRLYEHEERRPETGRVRADGGVNRRTC